MAQTPAPDLLTAVQTVLPISAINKQQLSAADQRSDFTDQFV
jgi:hypothetical protein